MREHAFSYRVFEHKVSFSKALPGFQAIKILKPKEMLKRFLKEIYQMYGGWMEALQWILILCHLACHCYLCRDGCVKCSNVVECARLVCVLSQPVPPSIHPSLHLADFF